MNAYVRSTGGGYQIMCISDAKVMGGNWSDWSGNSNEFSNGTHHFKIEVDEQFVDVLKGFGFDVKWYQKDETYPGFWFLDINISWKLRDPEVYVVAHNGVRTKQTEQTIGDLDGNHNIAFADMELSASRWEYMGRSGVKPYASNVYIYLGSPSSSEQRYQERFSNVHQPELPGMPQPALVNDEDDIPF